MTPDSQAESRSFLRATARRALLAIVGGLVVLCAYAAGYALSLAGGELPRPGPESTMLAAVATVPALTVVAAVLFSRVRGVESVPAGEETP